MGKRLSLFPIFFVLCNLSLLDHLNQQIADECFLLNSPFLIQVFLTIA
ncbi:hypothetical protein EV13_0788 [Prochlorococcus sp. MIT 0702]|nr:hypothetical protein EV12_1013 [Prochlorococcus sp. MIT 0701]KGG29857.1 hypothetical protein EV13_0788 [Prochlorococcus sp. MIT 0702]KGG33563.1 hypothetical protein EV14_1635 [Prochlorococcus sp. MIT 0703]